MTNSTTHNTTPEFVITADGELHGVDTPENREVVRRILACVNACEGIATSDLEAGVVEQMVRVMQGVQPLLSELNANNAELSKAS